MVDRYTCRRVAELPRCSSTFSSTLLDSIYRSIDRGEEGEMVVYRDLPRKKDTDFDADFLWMEKKVNRNGVVGRKIRVNSTSSSSDSSCGAGGGCGGFFSSAEVDLQRLKPVRTGKEKNYGDFGSNRRDGRGFGDQLEKKSKQEGGFLKTKSRALKIYGELKRVKQPISPGGKLAGFLNSIFTGAAGNLKKSKISGDDSPSLKSNNTSTCSSASSFSRSCLSKTPSSKSTSGAKRSVRFFPDCKSLHEETNNKNMKSISGIKSAINEELMVHIMEKNLMNYDKKNENGIPFDHSEEDEDEFDGESCASSDLFELDNLSGIGMEELPVYETTHLHTNKAIASIGLIL